MQSPEPLSNSGQSRPQKAPSANVGADETQSQLQTFTGTISKEGKGCVLRTSDKWFNDLDDQNEAEQYLNQHVVVTGTLNASGDLIHIRESGGSLTGEQL